MDSFTSLTQARTPLVKHSKLIASFLSFCLQVYRILIVVVGYAQGHHCYDWNGMEADANQAF
jgi:hypothetical protein